MAAATTLAPALAVTLGWAVTACREPEPPPEVDAGASAAAAAEAQAPAADPPAPEPEGCRDWSTLDLAELPPLTEGRQAALLDRVWRRVLEEHHDPTLGCLPWLALRERYAVELQGAATDDEAYRLIDAMLGELGQSHLRLFPPSRSRTSMGPASPALAVRWIEDQVVVVESRVEGVPAGAALLAIDGQPLQPLVEEVRGRSDAHGFPLELARAVAARLSCKRAGDRHALELAPLDAAAPRTHEVACVSPEGERVTLGNLRDIPTRVHHRMLDERVGLLAFNVWMLPMVERVRAAMHELRGQHMCGLVLDLRGNPGGVGAMAVPVARMLLDRSASLGTLGFRGFAQELVVEPEEHEPGRPGAFTGPVAVLVDEGTASTSEIFVVGLRDLGRITVVGARPSAGAALPSVIEQLPGGALLQYVVADYRSPGGTTVEGEGIVPDVVVPETRGAFADGRDPVLEAAHHHVLELVRNVPPPAESVCPPP
jgi:carboxyl-terminal processing protease